MRPSRPRYFVRTHWLRALRAAFRYSYLHDFYVLRGVGAERGPILKPERRRLADRRGRHAEFVAGAGRPMPGLARRVAA